MTLQITDISFRDFRSYDSFRLQEIGALTVFVGPNAVGKTNIIEGIQLLTALVSFRHATIEQLIKKEKESAHLMARFQDERRMLELGLAMDGKAKRYKLNGKAKRPADLRGLVPAVVFTPDDLELVKGSMSVRRQALDALGSQLNANYYQICKDYEKVIRHKNRLLKEEASPVLLDSIDEMLVTCGAQLVCYRAALFERLSPYVREHYRRISGGREALGAHYVPSWDRALPVEEKLISRETPTREQARAALGTCLEERRLEERQRHRALAGPHLDEVLLTLDGMDASVYGSQGQQRSVVLAWKLAEAAVVEDMLGQKPVLLLDDVMSELDGARREALVGYISQDVQTFITTANLAYFDEGMLSQARVVHLPLS